MWMFERIERANEKKNEVKYGYFGSYKRMRAFLQTKYVSNIFNQIKTDH